MQNHKYKKRGTSFRTDAESQIKRGGSIRTDAELQIKRGDSIRTDTDTDTVKIEKVEIVHDSGHLTLMLMMWNLMSSTVG